MTRRSPGKEPSTDTAREPRSAAHFGVALRVAAGVVLFVLLVAYLHRQLHAYASDMPQSPAAQLAGAALLLTLLVYVVILSVPGVPRPQARGLVAIFVWMLLLALGHAFSHQGLHDAQSLASSMRDSLGTTGLVMLAAAYTVALALPFVPGVELGLLIIALFGPVGAITAYSATVGGLSIAFAAGRLLPERVVLAVLDRVGIAVPVDGLATAMRDRVSAGRSARRFAHRIATMLFDYRYLALAMCLNFPGNSVFGGGGGLALLCGASRQFTAPCFVLTVALATAPIPLLVLAGVLNVASIPQHDGFLHDMLEWIDRMFVPD